MLISHRTLLIWRNEKGKPETCCPSIKSLISFGGMMSSALASSVAARRPVTRIVTNRRFDLMGDILEFGRADVRARGARRPPIEKHKDNEYILEDLSFPVKRFDTNRHERGSPQGLAPPLRPSRELSRGVRGEAARRRCAGGGRPRDENHR